MESKACLFALLVALATFVGVSNAQNATCNTNAVVPVTNFTLDRILGNWYTYGYYVASEEDVVPIDFTCLEIDHQRTNSDEFPLSFHSRFYNTTTMAYESRYSYGQISEEHDAIWKEFSFRGDDIREFVSVYMHTDYEHWAIQYTCIEYNGMKADDITVWTRSQTPDPGQIEVIEWIVADYGFPHATHIDHSNCE